MRSHCIERTTVSKHYAVNSWDTTFCFKGTAQFLTPKLAGFWEVPRAFVSAVGLSSCRVGTSSGSQGAIIRWGFAQCACLLSLMVKQSSSAARNCTVVGLDNITLYAVCCCAHFWHWASLHVWHCSINGCGCPPKHLNSWILPMS